MPQCERGLTTRQNLGIQDVAERSTTMHNQLIRDLGVKNRDWMPQERGEIQGKGDIQGRGWIQEKEFVQRKDTELNLHKMVVGSNLRCAAFTANHLDLSISHTCVVRGR